MDANSTFCNGLDNNNVKLVDATLGGALMRKTTNESFYLLDEMALNECKYLKERTLTRKPMEVFEVDVLSALTSQVAALVKKLDIREVN